VPGKHAPESPASFYLSVARAVGGAIVVLGVVALIAIAAVGSNDKKPQANSTASTTPHATATATVSSQPSTTSSATASASATAHPVSKVTVNVLNGTTRAGLARTVADKLSSDGYQVKKVDNCNCGSQSKTTIYYRSGYKADAQAMLRAHPELGRIAAATSDIPNAGAFLTVVLGTDYPVS
jgi:cytoskeletal protein RodZ